MHFGNFEDLNLQINEPIFFIDSKGKGLMGIYKGNYFRGKDTFDFLNFNGSKIETVHLKDIQNLQRNHK